MSWQRGTNCWTRGTNCWEKCGSSPIDCDGAPLYIDVAFSDIEDCVAAPCGDNDPAYFTASGLNGQKFTLPRIWCSDTSLIYKHARPCRICKTRPGGWYHSMLVIQVVYTISEGYITKCDITAIVYNGAIHSDCSNWTSQLRSFMSTKNTSLLYIEDDSDQNCDSYPDYYDHGNGGSASITES